MGIKFRHIIVVLSAGLLLACTEIGNRDNVRGSVTISAVSETPCKTTLGEKSGNDYPVLWNADDKIKLSDGSTAADFATSSDRISASGTSAEFSGEIPPAAGYAAIYPSTAFRAWDAGTSTLSFYRPKVQSYKEGTFAGGENFAVALGKGTLVFKNLFGVLRLEVYGEGSVSKVELTDANSDRVLWGEGTVKLGTGTAPEAVLDNPDSDRNTVLLECGKPVTLSQEEASCFHFVLPAGSLKSGFSVKFYDSSSKVLAVYSTEQDNGISRSTVVEMPAVGYAGDIGKSTFDCINLSYPGLEKVKALYEEGRYVSAASELLEYYRGRTRINPEVDLTATKVSNARIADQAIGHRFYTLSYYESYSGGVYTYYSLDDGSGNVSWDKIPSGVTDTEEFNKQIHRLLWMPYQAQAYYVTKDGKYTASIRALYDDYIGKYPCPQKGQSGSGVAYTGLQISQKLTGWMEIFPYIINDPDLSPAWLCKMLNYFDALVECQRNTWYYPIDSNIYLSQVQAESEFAVFFPEYASATIWAEDGFGKLSSQLLEQFNSDGVGKDLDPSYHMGVIENFRLVKLMAEANGMSSLLPSGYNGYLKNACNFMRDIVWPDCTCENFNDTRFISSRVILRNLERYAEMFPDDKEMLWMATQGASGAKPTSLVQKYPVSGYYMLRSGWEKNATMLVLKNNYNPDNKWHCQPDNCTISLWSKGRRFLPDPGCYSYANGADRTSFAATKIHCTLAFGASATTIKPIGNGYMKGEFLAHQSASGTELVATQNLSYKNLTHRRAVFMVDRTFFVILDEAYGSAEGVTSLNMSLSDVDNCVIDDGFGNCVFGAHTKYSDGNNMLYRTFVETTEGYSAAGDYCYYSDAIGEKVRRRRYYVNLAKSSGMAARYITVIYPFGAPSTFSGITVSARYTDNDGGTAGTFHPSGASAKVTVNGKEYELSYTLK